MTSPQCQPALKIGSPRTPAWHRHPMSDAQKATIARLGGDPESVKTKGEAHALISELLNRPSEKQMAYIRTLGGDPENVKTKEEAHALIDKLLADYGPTENETSKP